MSARGCLASRGVWPGGVSGQGVSAWGVSAKGVCILACTGADIPPWTE